MQVSQHATRQQGPMARQGCTSTTEKRSLRVCSDVRHDSPEGRANKIASSHQPRVRNFLQPVSRGIGWSNYREFLTERTTVVICCALFTREGNPTANWWNTTGNEPSLRRRKLFERRASENSLEFSLDDRRRKIEKFLTISKLCSHWNCLSWLMTKSKLGGPAYPVPGPPLQNNVD